MTSQALALQDAAILAGFPRKCKWGKKAFSIKTETKRVKGYHADGSTFSYVEYGDANLHDRLYQELTEEQALRIAEGIAKCGFSASVYIRPEEDGKPGYIHFHANTGWRDEGTYDVVVLKGNTHTRTVHKVEIDEELRRKAWKRANAKG